MENRPTWSDGPVACLRSFALATSAGRVQPRASDEHDGLGALPVSFLEW